MRPQSCPPAHLYPSDTVDEMMVPERRTVLTGFETRYRFGSVMRSRSAVLDLGVQESPLRDAADVLATLHEIAGAKVPDHDLEHDPGQRVAEQRRRGEGNGSAQQDAEEGQQLAAEAVAQRGSHHDDDKRQQREREHDELIPELAAFCAGAAVLEDPVGREKQHQGRRRRAKKRSKVQKPFHSKIPAVQPNVAGRSNPCARK